MTTKKLLTAIREEFNAAAYDGEKHATRGGITGFYNTLEAEMQLKTPQTIIAALPEREQADVRAQPEWMTEAGVKDARESLVRNVA